MVYTKSRINLRFLFVQKVPNVYNKFGLVVKIGFLVSPVVETFELFFLKLKVYLLTKKKNQEINKKISTF